MKSPTQYYPLTFAFEEVTTETSKAGFSETQAGLWSCTGPVQENTFQPSRGPSAPWGVLAPKAETPPHGNLHVIQQDHRPPWGLVGQRWEVSLRKELVEYPKELPHMFTNPNPGMNRDDE